MNLILSHALGPADQTHTAEATCPSSKICSQPAAPSNFVQLFIKAQPDNAARRLSKHKLVLTSTNLSAKACSIHT